MAKYALQVTLDVPVGVLRAAPLSAAMVRLAEAGIALRARSLEITARGVVLVLHLPHDLADVHDRLLKIEMDTELLERELRGMMQP
jgi:hypothetical protein